MAFLGVLADEIGEKEEFEDNEDDEQLDGNDEPERAPQRHASETIIVEMERFMPETVWIHG